MKTVVICRHAKSDWSQDLKDIDRPLNGRGEEDAPMMGKVLFQNGFSPDLIISSPAVRAKTTAKAVAEKLRYQGDVQIEAGIYHQGEGFILEMLKGLPDSVETVMVFGHNPTLEYVAANLLGSKGHITMPTSAMICMTSWAANWKGILPGSFNLQWHLIPKLIKQSVL